VIFKNQNVLVIFIRFLLLKLAIGSFFHLIYYSPEVGGATITTEYDKIFILFIGPIVETLIFQVLILEFVLRILARYDSKLIIGLLISSLTFMLTHNYSLFYIIMAFISGLIYAGLYLSIREKTQEPAIAFGVTTLLHISHKSFEFFIYG
jgi:Type II CAAX prenyl endopeptidase Rce1-like